MSWLSQSRSESPLWQFDGAFGFSEGRPGENLQAGIDCRRIKEVDFAIDLETMSWGYLLSSAEQGGEQLMVEFMGLFLIESGQVRFWDLLHLEMVKTEPLGLEIVHEIAETLPPWELRYQ